MENIVIQLIIAGVSIAALIIAAKYFNRNIEKIGIAFGFSPFIIGTLIAAIGTSSPELFSTIVAVIEKSPEFVSGNVTGSNICNIFLIMGISVSFSKKNFFTIEKEYVNVETQFLLGSALFIFLTFIDGIFSFYEGICSLLCYTVFISYLLFDNKTKIYPDKDNVIQKSEIKFLTYLTTITLILILYFSAVFLIESLSKIALYFNVGKEIIAASTISIGTSIPELTISFIAIKDGKIDYAIGTIVGSNIANSFLIMGISVLFGEIVIPESVIYTSMPFMIIATFMYFVITRDKKISRWEGMLFIIFYILYLAKIFNLF